MKKNLLSLEYFQRAAKNLQANKNCYGDRVAVVGQCKGADIALGLASVCPELVELTITQAGSIPAPIACDLLFGTTLLTRKEIVRMVSSRKIEKVKVFIPTNRVPVGKSRNSFVLIHRDCRTSCWS